MPDPVRIGCAAGFWGDSAEGARQLVDQGQLDFLVFDYLAEITMALLAKARAKDPAQGYAGDFPALVAEHAAEIKRQNIRVVSNAGGVNPVACKAAIEKLLAEQGIALNIAVVTGDDLLDRADALRADGITEMFNGAVFPEKPWSANAYLGALPIARALDDGADIVLTGRCVDSALALGPLLHHFGWATDDYDRLAMGSLAGHVIECGVQGTGGIVTDWETVAEGWHDMGFPIAEVETDGSFEVTKPEGTGGRIAPETVAEQIVYEIGDPAAYLLPDVCCDFSDVRLTQTAPGRVRVEGARGSAPGGHYKASVTWQDGFRCTATMMIGGADACARAEAVAEAILKRTRRLFAAHDLGDYRRTHVEVLGAEASWGPHARTRHTREVILKIATHHDRREALELFSREVIPSATSMAQGITGFAGGRPKPTPLLRLFSCLVPKETVTVAVDGEVLAGLPPSLHRSPLSPSLSPQGGEGSEPKSTAQPVPPSSGIREGGLGPNDTTPDVPLSPLGRGVRGEGQEPESSIVPLRALAVARSGDKGNHANIGVLARDPASLPLLRAQLTPQAVKHYLSHLVEGKVERFEWPGLHGFNFLLHEALGGGGTASLRHDPQGKMLAQILMDFPLHVPGAQRADDAAEDA